MDSTTVQKYKSLVDEKVHYFNKVYRIDRDVLESIAWETVYKVCKNHDDQKSPLEYRLRKQLNYACRSCFRQTRIPLQRTAMNLYKYSKPKSRSDQFLQLLNEISEDAKTVILLVLDTWLLWIPPQSKQAKTQAKVRSLLYKNGWSRERIDTTFGEIQRILHD